MKNFLILALLIVSIDGFAQVNTSISSDKKLVLTNSSNQFTYHVKVYLKEQLLKGFLLPPNGSYTLNYVVKRKRIAKKIKVSYVYDTDARNADRERLLSESKSLEYRAANIESECLKQTRQQGWALALAGLLVGGGRFIDALKEIVLSQNMDASDIRRQIKYIGTELESDYLNSNKKAWIELVLAYYVQLLRALEEPFTICPGLKYQRQTYLDNAQSLRNAVVNFDNKVENEQNRSPITESLWANTSIRPRLIPALPGFGIEVNQHISTMVLIGSASQNVTLQVAKPRQPLEWTQEAKLQLPLTRPFRGILYKLPSRLYMVATAGKLNFSFSPNTPDVYVGIQESGTGIVTQMVNSKGRLRLGIEYVGLGIKHLSTFSNSGNVYFSWEAGAIAIRETAPETIAPENFQSVGKEFEAVINPSITQNINPLNLNKFNPYFKIQFGVSLLTFGKRSDYPSRKKLVLGANFGITGLNSNEKQANYQLVQINTNQNKIANIMPLQPNGATVTLGAGLYLYL